VKIGVRAHDFGRQNAAALAEEIKNAGFECVQLAPAKAIFGINSFSDINETIIQGIREDFAKSDVEITVLGCYIEPSLPDKESRLANVEIFKNNLGFAKQLGVGIVGTETTGMDPKTSEAEREKVYQILKDSVQRMVEKAEKENVIIGIEPVAEHTLNTAQLTRRLLDEIGSKQLKVIFDPVNLVLPDTINNQAQIWEDVLGLIGQDIVAVHVKDIVIENNQKAWRNIGAGAIDYTSIIAWLKTHKPNMRFLREDVRKDSFETDRKAIERMIK